MSFQKDEYELSLATSLHDTVIPKKLQDLLMNSKCSTEFVPIAMDLIQHEIIMNSKIGIPEGWDRPLFPVMNFFRKFILNYLRNSPSVNGSHLELVLKGIGEASKRPPKLQLGIPSDMNQELDESEELPEVS